jgi:hypothetical protein
MTKPKREGKSKRRLYKNYEDLPIWNAVSKSVNELVNNGDLRETTASPVYRGLYLQEHRRVGKARS